MLGLNSILCVETDICCADFLSAQVNNIEWMSARVNDMELLSAQVYDMKYIVHECLSE